VFLFPDLLEMGRERFKFGFDPDSGVVREPCSGDDT
jgi:hypothetical protein